MFVCVSVSNANEVFVAIDLCGVVSLCGADMKGLPRGM